MENKRFNWIFSKEELQNTPSRKCGIDAEKELAYRQQAASMIQDMGQRLQVYPWLIMKACSPAIFAFSFTIFSGVFYQIFKLFLTLCKLKLFEVSFMIYSRWFPVRTQQWYRIVICVVENIFSPLFYVIQFSLVLWNLALSLLRNLKWCITKNLLISHLVITYYGYEEIRSNNQKLWTVSGASLKHKNCRLHSNKFCSCQEQINL